MAGICVADIGDVSCQYEVELPYCLTLFELYSVSQTPLKQENWILKNCLLFQQFQIGDVHHE